MMIIERVELNDAEEAVLIGGITYMAQKCLESPELNPCANAIQLSKIFTLAHKLHLRFEIKRERNATNTAATDLLPP